MTERPADTITSDACSLSPQATPGDARLSEPMTVTKEGRWRRRPTDMAPALLPDVASLGWGHARFFDAVS